MQCETSSCSSSVYYSLESFFLIEHTIMSWDINLFFKIEYRPVAKNYCSNRFCCFCKTRKSINMSISASKTEHLFSRIPCSGYFFIENVTHTKTLNFSLLFDGTGWSTIGQSKDNSIYIYLYTCTHTYIFTYTPFFFLYINNSFFTLASKIV